MSTSDNEPKLEEDGTGRDEAGSERILLDFPGEIERAYPDEFPLAWEIIEQNLDFARSFDSTRLERNHPALNSYDWAVYLRCSVVRMVRLAARLNRAGETSGRVLEYGAWFGNFSQMLAATDFDVDAIDTYRAYSPTLDNAVDKLAQAGVRVLDFEDHGFDLQSVPASSYDIVLFLSVIEHIPHTPRPVLEAIDRVLKPGGLLVVDTPNLAYLDKRQKLSRGESVHPDICSQFYSQIPFHGHHREYTVAEIEWMLSQLGHQHVSTELFNYSLYSGGRELLGSAAADYLEMQADPLKRELMLVFSRKPERSSGSREIDNGGASRTTPFVADERSDPATDARKFRFLLSKEREEAQALREAVADRQREVNVRDEMLRVQGDALQELQRQVQALLVETTKRDREIQKRDEMLQAVQARAEALVEQAESADREILPRRSLVERMKNQTNAGAAALAAESLGDRDLAVQRLQRQVQELLTELGKGEQEVARRDALLNELQPQVQEALQEIGRREAEVAKRDELVHHLQGQVNSLLKQLGNQELEVDKRDRMLLDVQRQVQESLEEIARRDAEVTKRDAMLRGVHTQYLESIRQLEQRDAELAKLRRLVKCLDDDATERRSDPTASED